MKTIGKYIVITLLTLFEFGTARAQQKIYDPSLIRLLTKQDSLHKHLPIEKAYVQTDKSIYTVGDTIWLKAWVFNADYLNASSRSGLLYVELINDSAEVASRVMMPLLSGIGIGQVAIDGKDVPEGSYTLRAYTNWMRNFGDDYIFSKNLYIRGNGNKPWLVNVKTGSIIENDKENVHASLSFTDAKNESVIFREMKVRVEDGSRTLFRGKTQTDAGGVMNINFSLPRKTDIHNLSIVAQDLRNGEESRQMNVPLALNRPENTDLQFMPESGNLINGITSTVAFKAVGEDGKGEDVKGKIYNSKQELVTAFGSVRKGMGTFRLLPQAGETYTAKIDLPAGATKSYPLPKAQSSGTALTIDNNKADSLTITIASTPDLQGTTLYFVAQARGVICYARSLMPANAATRTFSIAKNLFPSGITRLSLLNKLGQVLNERVVYIDHHDNLKIAITTDKPAYGIRDSVALQVTVTDKEGRPVRGSFGLAVTDDDQVPTDSLARNTMTNNLLLTSDLKGTVEDPGYYTGPGASVSVALDDLMLTQGWIGYSWQTLTAPASPIKFEAEPEFQVKGSVVNLFNKPIAGANLILLARKSGFTKITNANDKGQFVFKEIPVIDSALFFVEATKKKGGNFGVGITVEQQSQPEFHKPAIRYLPWYINTDTALQKSVTKAVSQRLEEEKQIGGHMLKDVNIVDKKAIKGSYNLNGPGAADQVLDEHLMDKSGDMSLEELLTKNVKGFHVGFPNKSRRVYYMVVMRIVHLFIDGVDIKTRGEYNETKSYMDNFTAKDIRGIEILNSVKYKLLYDPPGWHDGGAIEHEMGSNPPMFIEVTTRANVGPNLRHVPGTYVYRPVPFMMIKQFYRPRYTIKTPGAIKDLRSTIHWEPNLITDSLGKATVSFYTSDRPAPHYTITIEGSDMNGNIGSVSKKLTGL